MSSPILTHCKPPKPVTPGIAGRDLGSEVDVDELELRLQEALQESEEQHRSLAEENATLQQRVRQVGVLCCAAQVQGLCAGWAGLFDSRAHVGNSSLQQLAISTASVTAVQWLERPAQRLRPAEGQGGSAN